MARAQQAEITNENFSDSAVDKLATQTGDILRDQPKKEIRLHLPPERRKDLEAQEKAGKEVQWPAETVWVNGYPYVIALGKDVEVPQEVYEILKRAGRI